MPADRKRFTTGHGETAFDADSFREWLKEKGYTRAAGEGDVDFARRVFLGLRAAFTYEYNPDQKRSAAAVCRDGKSDCGGLSNLFVAALRANGVPARVLLGRWAESSDPAVKLGGEAYHQWHAKAEFFAAGVGWVPADLASGLLHDKSAEGLRFFGDDPGDFLAFHTDTDVTFDTKLFGVETVSNLQSPVWWVRGGGKLDRERTTEDWKVEKLK